MNEAAFSRPSELPTFAQAVEVLDDYLKEQGSALDRARLFAQVFLISWLWRGDRSRALAQQALTAWMSMSAEAIYRACLPEIVVEEMRKQGNYDQDGWPDPKGLPELVYIYRDPG